MTDISVDDDFLVTFDETNDLGVVTESEEFEQEIRHFITEYFFEYIGDKNTSNIVQKLEMQAKRVARDSDFLSSLDSVEVLNQEGDRLEMQINYNGSEEYRFVVV